MESLTPSTPFLSIEQPSFICQFSSSNINYLLDEARYSISVKFYQQLPSLNNIPIFTPSKLDDWKDRLKSYLRSCHSLDNMLREPREATPVMVDSESLMDFEKRSQIYRNRDRAFYLILDKSLSSAQNLDPKYLSLSEQLNNDEGNGNIGHRLYDGIMFLVKGSHLYARIDSINNMMNLVTSRINVQD